MSATTASREPSGFLARRFRLHERGTSPRTEVLGGVATFLTMSYIVFVNPAILSAAGVPLDAVIVCTALAAADHHGGDGAGHQPAVRARPGPRHQRHRGVRHHPRARPAVAGRHGGRRHRGPGRRDPRAGRAADGDHGGGPDLAQAGDRRRHRPLHHARRPARGRHRGQQPGHRHRPRRPHGGPAADRPRRHPRRGRPGGPPPARRGHPRRGRRHRPRPDLRRARGPRRRGRHPGLRRVLDHRRAARSRLPRRRAVASA